MMRRSLALAFSLSVVACGQATRTPALDSLPEAGGAPDSVPVAAGGEGGGSPQLPEPSRCEEGQPGAAPISRLTNDELRRTLTDLVGTAQGTELLPPEDEARTVTTLFVEQTYSIARATAEAVTTDPEKLAAILDCDPAKGADACQAHFLERFLRRAFRRPPMAADLAEMGDVFRRGEELGGGFDSGVRAVIEVTLQSPEFLYLLEMTAGASGGSVAQLTPFEIATRLSYFLTGGPPDATLSASADDGSLLEAAGLSEQLRRLVGGAQNREHVVEFYRRVYGLHNDGSADPPLSPELVAFARTETRLFVEDVTFTLGSFRALLTDPSTWLNQPLAELYGSSQVAGEAFRRVSLDPSQRAGLFTQQAFLDATSPGARPGSIQRGVFVLKKLLCFDLPSPPVLAPPVVPPDSSGGTWRERIIASTSSPECATCHEALNATAIAFEHYDSVGRYRTLDGGLPIDASGVLPVTDAAGPFADATELLQNIAASQDGQACFVAHWAELALRRRPEPTDTCLTEELERRFRASDGNVVALMIDIAQSDRFKYRLASELAP